MKKLETQLMVIPQNIISIWSKERWYSRRSAKLLAYVMHCRDNNIEFEMPPEEYLKLTWFSKENIQSLLKKR